MSMVEYAARCLADRSYKNTHRAFSDFCDELGVSRSAVYSLKNEYYRKGKTEIPGGVYFIVCDELDAVKVGWSTSIKKRLEAIQIACPVDVRLLAVMDNTEKDCESSLHEMFSRHHIRGEWFRYGGTIERFIDAILQKGIATCPIKESHQ